MPLQRFKLKFLFSFFTVLAAVVAQDATSYLTSDVIRVGGRLACRCGGCRNTVGDCPMLRCSSADPLRHRIYAAKQKGLSDNAIVESVVREEGIVALSSPPGQGLGPIITWVMPGLVLVFGFFVYSAFVRRHRRTSPALTESDQALIDRFHTEIDRDWDDVPDTGPRK